ncbi:MAG: hypothetical protein M1617_00735 [Actinobacteria bacterium]|nr:hypothetical protein [Actinomycetota bacterium]MCL5886822.1 hypothetical protein [Actinomycetota bacterium]
MLRFEVVPVGRGDIKPCPRCPRPVDPHYYDPGDLDAKLSGVAAGWGSAPGPNVVLAGPEPLNHPRLPELVRLAVDRGVKRLGLRTDAAGLTVGRNAEGVIASGVRHLHVVCPGDVLGPTTGHTGASRSLAGILAFTEAAEQSRVEVAIVGIVPVCAHNLHLLPEVVAMLASKGARLIRLEIASSAIDEDELAEWCVSAFHTGILSGAWVDVPDAPPSVLTRIDVRRSPLVLALADTT